MTSITERFESMKRNELKTAHFNSADVVSNATGKTIVLYSNDGSTIDVIFYKTSENYVNQEGVVLRTTDSYSLALELAQMILG